MKGALTYLYYLQHSVLQIVNCTIIYAFYCGWTFGLFPAEGYYKKSSCEHLCIWVLEQICMLELKVCVCSPV